jgi:predicted RNA polymerase sigma factor
LNVFLILVLKINSAERKYRLSFSARGNELKNLDRNNEANIFFDKAKYLMGKFSCS